MKKLVVISLPEELDKAMSEEMDALITKYQEQSLYKPELIDMGLPSGRLWADRNIGATAPEEYGDLMDHYDACAYVYTNRLQTPTREDFVELDNNCTHGWTDVNGVKGMMFTSKINGNTLFFPAAGDGFGTSLYDAGSVGFYWSRSLVSGGTSGYYLYFSSSGVYPQDDSHRYYGFSVRAVQ